MNKCTDMLTVKWLFCKDLL